MATVDSTVTYRDLEPLGFPGYRVGDDGSVWSCRHRGGVKGRVGNVTAFGSKWRRLKPSRTYAGHLSVLLWGGDCPKRQFIHRLVLLAFVGPCPEGMECCHGDGDPGNNTPSNLRWDSPKANAADAKRHGRTRHGESHGAAKLTAAQVRAIRDEYAAGSTSIVRLATGYGVTEGTIAHIVHRRKWKHIP